MTKNRDVFFKDPTAYTIPNDGVAEVTDPRTREQWAVLHYELSNFVCKGEYQRGLEVILSTYLTHLHREKQPAVWVSGFYGSGKSHFVRVLQYLWRDTIFPDGARARGLTHLPRDVEDFFIELTTAGKREGGLWSAAGTLGAGAGNSVRLALLGILFRSAGLPEQYAPARFVIWLMQNGYYKDFRACIERSGSDFFRELNNMYVSRIIAESLLAIDPEFATSIAEVRNLIKAQYPSNKEDISDDEMLHTMEDVLELQSTTPGKWPCTLLVCDELQQYIGQDSKRTFEVQTVVETCCSHFGTRLLFVATGQAAIQATTQLQKLQGRFTTQVMLADADVEQVVREVVLRKKPSTETELQAVLHTTSGEIDRHLAGTKIGPNPDDNATLVTDYPLLPVRRRFWERFLRVIDSSGTVGQLRTQLRIVHEAIKEIANKPIGTVVAGDVIYNQLKANMLQSTLLLRDVETKIAQLNDGTPDGKLRSRLCATVFLIGQLPKDGITATGIRADAATFADLLVEDLTAGSTTLRQRIPTLLQDLVDSGTLMQMGDEYRIQTLEGANWEADYRRRYTRIQADDSRIASDRTVEFQRVIKVALKGITAIQGQSKTARKLDIHTGLDFPSVNTDIPVWIRDEWSVAEKTVREDAQHVGDKSPIIFVFLPHHNTDALKDAIASYAAAHETIASRAAPTSREGKEAKNAMESKRQMEQARRDALIENIVNSARVYQGGGNDVTTSSLQASIQASVRTAIDGALIRLFPNFSIADHPSWNVVVKRAIDGSSDPLSVVGYNGNVNENPACKEILSFVDSLGKKGSDIRKHFMGAGYGWPQDAVDGALLCLVAGGFIRATRNGQPLGIKQITTQQLGLTEFYREGITVSTSQRISIRKLIVDIGLQIKQGEEAEAIPMMLKRLAELATASGGDAPLPERPSAVSIEQLRMLSGNEQLIAVYEQRDELLNNFKTWSQTRQKIAERLPRWEILKRLFTHAHDLPVTTEIKLSIEAIKNDRRALQDPDPVSPLIKTLATALRATLSAFYQQMIEERDREVRTLGDSEEWQRLSESDRQRLLVQFGLASVSIPRIGTDEELLSILDTSPLPSWEEKIATSHMRVVRVREETIKLLSPKALYIRAPQATLNSADEVDAYLAKFRADIMKHLEAGNPVVI